MVRKKPVFCFLAVAGSATETLGIVADGLLASYPEAEIVVLNTEVFNTKAASPVKWRRAGRVLDLTFEQFGMRDYKPVSRLSPTINFVLNGGEQAFSRMIKLARRLFEEIRPDIIFTCNDTFYGQRAFLKAAKLEGARTVLLQEGPFSIVRPANSRRRGVKQLAGRIGRGIGMLPESLPYGAYGHALVLAGSDHYAEKFRLGGAIPETIKTVGLPRFDALHGRCYERPLKHRVTYVFQPFVAHGKVDASQARSVLEELADGLNAAYRSVPFELVLRPHPRSDQETMDFVKGRLSIPYVVDASEPLEAAVLKSSVAIGHYSVGLLECVMLGVPILCVPMPASAFSSRDEARKQTWLAQSGVTTGSTAQEISLGLSDLLSGAQRSKIDISDEVGVLDGNATARVVSLTGSLL